MTNVPADEVPFLSSEKLCETTVKVGKKLFTLDGMVDRILGKARSAMEARSPDRGPDPDVADDEERILVPVRLFEQFRNSGYREAPKPPKDPGLKAVIIGCSIAIVSSGIIGGIVLSNEFSAMRAQVMEWQKSTDRRLDQLERRP